MLQTPNLISDSIDGHDAAVTRVPGGGHPLQALFCPETVAVIGDVDQVGTGGHTLFCNLMNAPFQGAICAITARPSSLPEIPTYDRLQDVPYPIDLAVIVAPLARVPAILDDCIAVGVESALLISAGFRESGAIAPALEAEIRQRLQGSRLRLLGPNSLGIMNPRHGLNATLAGAIARPGSIGFISQSGALCRSILDWSAHERVGFSAFISLGSMMDVGWGDLITYLGDDPYTQSIIIHMESVGDARSFLSAAREVAFSKPIILIKGGRSEAAGRAVTSHTGAIADCDAVFEAAIRRCGVLRVNRLSELFNMAEVLAKRDFQLSGPRLTILSNSGGLGVLATDALIASGGQLGALSPDTLAQLDQVLPAEWSHQNPIDILGDADSNRFQRAMEIAIRDANTDGLLVIFTPQGVADPTDTAEKLTDLVEQLQDSPLGHKPILASWMGGAEVLAGESILNHHQVPTYPYPDSAARLFNLMWQHSYSLRGLYETPLLPVGWEEGEPQRQVAQEMIHQARSQGRTVLNAAESAQLLGAYGIPVLSGRLVTQAEEAVAQAEFLGYPVVLKLPFKPGVHTPDQGGVELNLNSAAEVRTAFNTLTQRALDTGVMVQPMVTRDGGYELLLASHIDPQFGPVITVGKGGRLLEIYRDRAVALPPLNTTLARRLLEQTQIYQALQGEQGYPAVSLAALEDLLVKFSQLVVEQRWIAAIAINPLWVQPSTADSANLSGHPTPPLVAIDAQVTLHGPEMTEADLPRLAIRPYPNQYVTAWPSPQGRSITLRPIRPEDEPLIVDFHRELSEESVYLYFAKPLSFRHRVAHERLARICFLDYDREITLVADYKQPGTGNHAILGAARLLKQHGFDTARFVLVVQDADQHQGLGTELLRQLIQVAQAEGLHRLSGTILAENAAMLRVASKLGFQLTPQGTTTEASLTLQPT